MKNRFTCCLCIFVGVFLTLLMLGACNAKIIRRTETKKAEVRMTTVEVWTNNASSKTEDVKMVYDFNNGQGKEKGIMIDYKILGEEYQDMLQAAIAAKQGPALFKSSNLGTSSVPKLVNRGWIVAIEDIADGKEFLTKYEGRLQPITNTYKGKTYTVPYAVTTMAVAYNKDLLKKNGYLKPPETWAEMTAMAKTITKNGRGKEFGFIEGLKSNIHSQNGLLQYASSVGHAEFNPKSGKFNFIDFIPFFQMWVNMEKEGSTFPGCEELNNDQARAQFAEGNIGFKFSASYDVGVWRDQFPIKINWGICRPVEDPANKYKNYAYQIPSLAFGKRALEIPEKAMEVFKLWNGDETLLKLYERGKYIPYNQEIINMAKKGPEIKNWVEFADLSNTWIGLPNPMGEIDIQGDNDLVGIQKVIKGEVTVKNGLKDLEKRYNAALDRAISEGLDLTSYIDTNLDTRVKNSTVK